MKLIMRLNPSMLSVNAAITSPRPPRPMDTIRAIIMLTMKHKGDMVTPTMNDSTSRMAACIIEAVLIPKAFPKTIDGLDIGATSISLRKPYCLSIITETPENMLVNSMVWPIIPG